MATYAIGDVHGCYEPLCRLLDKIAYDSVCDDLWFVGDLINRGPASLEVLCLIQQMGKSANPILGNHDFHLLVQYLNCAPSHPKDTLGPILDSEQALHWVNTIRHWPLLGVVESYLIVHAGLLPQWSIELAIRLAKECEFILRGNLWKEFIRVLYRNKPLQWSELLCGHDRLRMIVNGMTRLRFCTPEGCMNFSYKGASFDRLKGYIPWFDCIERQKDDRCIITGHWSSIGLKVSNRHIAIDTGCVWGGSLTALRLEDKQIFSVPYDS